MFDKSDYIHYFNQLTIIQDRERYIAKYLFNKTKDPQIRSMLLGFIEHKNNHLTTIRKIIRLIH